MHEKMTLYFAFKIICPKSNLFALQQCFLAQSAVEKQKIFMEGR